MEGAAEERGTHNEPWVAAFVGHADGSFPPGVGDWKVATRAAHHILLATLSLPYAHRHTGDVADERWASIHSWPPWEDTDEPTIVEHRFGAGRAIYSAFDIEREDADVNDRVFARMRLARHEGP